MSWGIAETAPKIEKIKAESADYLNGLSSCGAIDYDDYSYAFDFYMGLIDEAHKTGLEEGKLETDWFVDDPEDEGVYIVTIQCEHIDGLDDYVTGCAEWDGRHWDIVTYFSGQIKVVAWAEMPKPLWN